MKPDDQYYFFDLLDFESTSTPLIPTLLLSDNLPYKLFFSINKSLTISKYPSLSHIFKTFSSNPYQTSETFAIGTQADGHKQLLTESIFNLEIQFSKFSIIQAYFPPSYEKLFHKIEFRSTHYNSFTMVKRKNETIINDEIFIEKQLFGLTANCAESIEKTGKIVQILALEFFVDELGNFIFLHPYEWILINFIEDKGIRSIPTIFASFQKVKRDVITRNYSIGIKPRPIQAKPRVQFKEKKYSNMKLHLSLMTFSQKINNPVIYCNGDYCELGIKDLVKRNRRVSLYLYQALPHRLIRATALSIKYPVGEVEFEDKFKKLYDFNLKSIIGNPNNEMSCPLSLKQNNITICAVCFKVFSIVRDIHFIVSQPNTLNK